MMKQKITTPLIPLLLFGLICLGSCAQIGEAPAEYKTKLPGEIAQPQETSPETRKEAEPVAPTKSPAEEDGVIIKPPEVAIDKYQGVWLPFPREVAIALGDIDNLKADGINTVSIGIKIRRDGDIFQDEGEKEIKKALNEFHKNGIKTFLILNPAHPDLGISPSRPEASGKPLLDKLTPLVLKWAQIAEDYAVEIFCPVNEPQLLSYQKENDVSHWAQEILPQLREIYHGKLAFLVQATGDGLPNYDLTGYDYVALGGFGADSDIDTLPEAAEYKIDESLARLKTAYPDLEYIYFGVGAFTGPDYYWWEPIAPANMPEHMPELPVDFFIVSPEGQAKFFNMFFAKSWEQVDGYFISVYKGCEYRNKPAEQVIRKWFNTGKPDRGS